MGTSYPSIAARPLVVGGRTDSSESEGANMWRKYFTIGAAIAGAVFALYNAWKNIAQARREMNRAAHA